MTPLPLLTRQRVLSDELQTREDLTVPTADLLALPEKALQFGTGGFLRGFVDYFIDRANRAGQFGGRVVMVSSTGSGRADMLNRQDGLYTLVVQGVRDGERHTERRIVGSVSRAIAARTAWGDVVDCARNPELRLIFSNTTETGIRLDGADAPGLEPPRSYPGKLTTFLYARATAFDFDPDAGLTVVPCELIEGNGARLQEIVHTLAAGWFEDDGFDAWLRESVRFVDTLVDRIVPGTPDAPAVAELERSLGYRDELLTIAEVYRLFAIEGNGDLRSELGFADADEGVLVTDDVAPYRERKLRLLNGTHTIMVPAALLCGHQTVEDAVEGPLTGEFIRRIAFDEFAPATPADGATAYAADVLERFRNPFIRHELFDITLQSTLKMRVRVVPLILRYAERTGQAPPAAAFGFGAFLLFMRGDLQDRRREDGRSVPVDDSAGRLRDLWQSAGTGATGCRDLVRTVCADETLWGTDLRQVPGFVDAVTRALERLLDSGPRAALAAHLEEHAGEGADRP